MWCYHSFLRLARLYDPHPALQVHRIFFSLSDLFVAAGAYRCPWACTTLSRAPLAGPHSLIETAGFGKWTDTLKPRPLASMPMDAIDASPASEFQRSISDSDPTTYAARDGVGRLQSLDIRPPFKLFNSPSNFEHINNTEDFHCLSNSWRSSLFPYCLAVHQATLIVTIELLVRPRIYTA